MQEEITLTMVLELIKAGGVIAALITATWAFYTGKVVSRPLFEQMTGQITANVIEALIPTIKSCTREVVTEALEEYFDDKSREYFLGD